MPSPILHPERPERPRSFRSLVLPPRALASTIEYRMRKSHRSETFSAKFFRFRSYEKCACKSFRIRSYKNIGLKVPRFHTLTKNTGGVPLPVDPLTSSCSFTPSSAWASAGDSRYSAPFAEPGRETTMASAQDKSSQTGDEMRRQFLMVLALLATAGFVGAAAESGPYQLKQKFTIGGDGGWDYLTYDTVGKRLFISRPTRVQVVDPQKATVIEEIPNTPGVNSIALAEDLGKG